MRGKPKDGSKNPGGRPRRELNARQVQKLARLGLTLDELASVLECSKTTLERYSTVIKDAHEHRNSSLRRWQFEQAKRGNTTMLIWLGKQYLGQKDKNELGGPDGAPIPVSMAVPIFNVNFGTGSS